MKWLAAFFVVAWFLLTRAVQTLSLACTGCCNLVTTTCCPSGLPATLTVTIGAIGGACAGISGLSWTITWNGLNAWTGSAAGSPCNGGTCTLSATLQCVGGGGDCTGLQLLLSTGAPCNGSLQRAPDSGCSCSPLSLTYSGIHVFDFGTLGVACCGVSPQNGSVTVTA